MAFGKKKEEAPKKVSKKYPEGSWTGKDGNEYVNDANGNPQKV